MSTQTLSQTQTAPRLSLGRWWPKRWYIHLVLLLGAVVTTAPLLWMITMSLKPARLTYSPPYLIPTVFEWSNYAAAWQAAPFARYYLNTAIMALGITLCQLLFSSLAAYAFARLKFPGRDLLFLVVLGTMMVPIQVLIIPSYLIVKDFGWQNTFWALIVPRAVSAFGIFLLRQHYLSIPRELDEAAMIDGASRLGVWWRIILPLSRPALATLAVFAFMGTWTDLLWPLLIARSPEMRTLELGLAYFNSSTSAFRQTNWPLMMAASVIVMLPVLLVYIFSQRYFVRGISLSGVKG